MLDTACANHFAAACIPSGPTTGSSLTLMSSPSGAILAARASASNRSTSSKSGTAHSSASSMACLRCVESERRLAGPPCETDLVFCDRWVPVSEDTWSSSLHRDRVERAADRSGERQRRRDEQELVDAVAGAV